MSKFEYKSRDDSNNIVTGVLEKNEIDDVIDALHKKNLTPITIHKVDGSGLTSEPLSDAKQVPGVKPWWDSPVTREILEFTRELSLMLKSSIPLVHSLEQASRAQSTRFQKRIKKIISDMVTGQTLSEAFENQKSFFPRYYLRCLKSAEASSNIVPALSALSAYLEKSYRYRNWWQWHIRFLFFAGGILVSILGLVVFTLWPVPAQDSALSLVNWIRRLTEWGAWLTLPALATIYLFVTFTSLKIIFYKSLENLPFVDKLLEIDSWFNFCANHAMLIKAGHSHTTPLADAIFNISHSGVRVKLDTLVQSTSRGIRLSSALEALERPPYILTRSVVQGEAGNDLDRRLEFAGDYYARQHGILAKKLSRMILFIYFTLGILFLLLAFATGN